MLIEQFGLLRVGSVEGSLHRELKLRKALGDYGMIAKLLAHTTVESVLINPPSTLSEPENNQEKQKEVENIESLSSDRPEITHESADFVDLKIPEAICAPAVAELIASDEDEVIEETVQNVEITQDISAQVPDKTAEDNSGYLEEEYYPELDISIDESKQQLLLLTDFPSENGTLATWLQEKRSTEEYLSIAIHSGFQLDGKQNS